MTIHNIRKEPKLDYPFLGYKITDEKVTLQTTGNLDKVVQVTPKNDEPFSVTPPYLKYNPHEFAPSQDADHSD